MDMIRNRDLTQEALNWVTWCMDQARELRSASVGGGIYSVVAELTPALAEVLLSLNEGNRTIRAPRLEQIKSDLMTGRMMLNGESIIISNESTLNDGQHRCQAVVETGISYKTLFVFGASRDSRLSVDQGTPKQAGDYLTMGGEGDGYTRASMAAILMAWRDDRSRISDAGRHYTPIQKTQYATENKEAIDFGLAAWPHSGGRNLCGSRALVCSIAIYLRAETGDTEAVIEFMDKLRFGDALEAGSPILALRNSFRDGKLDRKDQDTKADRIFQAWVKWRRGVTNTKILRSRKNRDLRVK